MTTRLALAPGPAYVTGMTIGGGAAWPGTDGVAVTGAAPLKTMTFAALMYSSVTVSASPLIGVLGSSFTLSDSVRESASAGKTISVSSARL